MNTTIIERESGHKTVVVTTRNGYCYAVTYAPDTIITREKVLQDWRTDRKAFLPFNTATLQYCEDKSKAYYDIF